VESTIVVVVGRVKQYALLMLIRAWRCYLPHAQFPMRPYETSWLRTGGDPADLAGPVRGAAGGGPIPRPAEVPNVRTDGGARLGMSVADAARRDALAWRFAGGRDWGLQAVGIGGVLGNMVRPPPQNRSS
jgi:hypothetical protein